MMKRRLRFQCPINDEDRQLRNPEADVEIQDSVILGRLNYAGRPDSVLSIDSCTFINDGMGPMAYTPHWARRPGLRRLAPWARRMAVLRCVYNVLGPVGFRA